MASCHIPVKQFPTVDFFFNARFFQRCPYSVFSARRQNTPDKTEAPTSVLYLKQTPLPESHHENRTWSLGSRDCSIRGKLEFLRTVAFFGNIIFLRGGRFALFYCSSPQKQLGNGVVGNPPWTAGLRGAVSARRPCSWSGEARSPRQAPPAAGAEQDVPPWVQWVDACPAKSGFGRCMQKLSNWSKNICWVIEKEEQASPQGSE